MTENKKDVATLTIPSSKSIQFPIHKASIGQDVVDITSLLKESNMFTYDPGFISTASCESKITYIDGDAGILRHRGYPIEQLAEKSNFLETSYLLVNGELPNKSQYEDFHREIYKNMLVHEQLHILYRGRCGCFAFSFLS